MCCSRHSCITLRLLSGCYCTMMTEAPDGPRLQRLQMRDHHGVWSNVMASRQALAETLQRFLQCAASGGSEPSMRPNAQNTFVGARAAGGLAVRPRDAESAAELRSMGLASPGAHCRSHP